MEEIKTRFISSATHEIRTPLTSIQGYIELITADSEGLSQGDNLKYFQVIARNVNRLERLTDDLLEIQRMDSKKVNLDLESVMLSTILSELKYEFVPLLASKSQKLVIENAFEHLRLVCDRLRLMQVFSNLVNNASKFSDEGAEIMIRISVGDSVLRVEVMDEGIGITEKNLLKLFYPFPDIDKGIRYEGTGLGLSICKSIIDLHGGTIKAESDGLGKGSTFIFTIPIAEGNLSL